MHCICDANDSIDSHDDRSRMKERRADLQQLDSDWDTPVSPGSGETMVLNRAQSTHQVSE